VHHVVEAVQAAGPRTLVLVDELMAGTDPEEGAALARVVLRWLADRGGVTLVTTHLSDLKLFAHSEPGLANAGMSFDPDSRTPLYRLQAGVPGSSNAIATAARLGLPAELLDAARQGRGDAAGRLEAALASLEAERAQMAAARAQARSAEAEAKRIREEYAELHAQLAAKRRTASEDARREAARMVTDAKARIEQVVRDLRSRGADRDSIHSAHQTLRQLEASTQPLAETAAPRADAAGARAPTPGDRVWVRGLLREGILEEVDAGGRARVRLGNVPFAVAFADLERLGDAAPQAPPRGGYAAPQSEEPQAARLDVRGMERADAITALEQFLDRAVLHGSPQLEIVHGKGTGVLRRAVQDLLARHPDVAEFRLGAHGEGGSGVTVVKLR
jgi:DNA mismatch repair protein MutS2